MKGLEIKDNPTGVFFYKQNEDSLIKAISCFENNLEKIQTGDCRKNALNFSIGKFKKELKEYINNRFYGIDKDEKNIY